MPLVTGTIVATVAAVGAVLVPTGSAMAAVPDFPNNIAVFPDRDFISVEGYEERVGQTATIEVTRSGVGIIGSAKAVVQTGGVAFEVNHPGGVCWGAGTGLNVTPDIRPNDVVSLSFAGTPAGDTRVRDSFVTGLAVNGGTVTVDGHIGAGVDPNNIEQRIVQPDLLALIGKRDVRAIPGPLTPAPKGGYSSSLVVTGETFQATYVFLDPDGNAGPLTAASVAQVAASSTLGARVLAWEVTDPDGNRQGVTISEFGESGGPGFGGCPNGPLQAGPAAPTDVVATVVNGAIRVNWTPAVAIAGTPAITGYRVHAVARTVNAAGEQIELGKRIAGRTATGTTISGIVSGETYDVEVASVSSAGETTPRVVARAQVDITPPTLTVTPGAGGFTTPPQVRLAANEAGSQIFYTLDGLDPLDSAGDPVLSAIAYTGPFTISADTTLKVVAFDTAGNPSDVVTRVYTVTNTPTPDAPTFGTNSVGNGSITLSWSSSDPSVSLYGVQLYDAAGAPARASEETAATTLTITGLTPDTPYFATVKAKNINGFGPESPKAGPLTPTGAVVAVAGPDQVVARRATPTTVTLTGAGSTSTGATYAWTQVKAADGTPIPTNDPDKVTLNGATTLAPTFSLRLYATPQTNNALVFRLTVTTSAGSKSDEVKVTPTPSRATITTGKWKAGDLRVTGSDSLVGTTVTVRQGGPTGAVLGQAAVTAAAAPATGGTWSLRLRTAAANTNPGTVWVESTGGGTAGPFTVTNG